MANESQNIALLDAAETPKRDYRQEVTDELIQMLEKGTAPWQKPWNPENAGFVMPMNPTTEKPYRGGNALHLLATATQKGYEDPRWMTYRQAQENGWQVRKGEKGTAIEFWQFPGRDKTDGKEADPDSPASRAPLRRIYTVFNAKQIEGVPEWEPKHRPEWEVVQTGEAILTASGARILHDQQDRAYYSRGADEIHLPGKSAFEDSAGYYGTALHELAHWRGHESRLNRETLTKSDGFGGPTYAKEELRAELTSMFLAAERGIPHDPEQHAAYVGSWIQVLQKDKNEIFRAARDAQNAADFIIGLEQKQELQRPAAALGVQGYTPIGGDSKNPNETALREGRELPQSRRETSEWVADLERGSGTVDLIEKGTATEHRLQTAENRNGRASAGLQQQQIEDNRVDSDRTPGYGTIEESFRAATELAKARLGPEAKTIAAEPNSGTYQGEILGQTSDHAVMKLSNAVAVAHPKSALNGAALADGSQYRINYNQGVASVAQVQLKQKSLGLSR